MLNKDKHHFRCISVPFFGKIIPRHGIQPNPHKLCALTEMPSPQSHKELLSLLGVIKYLSKHLLAPSEICEPLRRLTLVNKNGTGTKHARNYTVKQRT